VVEETVERLEPGGLDEVYDLEGALGTQLFPMRAASWISSLLGAIALYLTLTGLYGVLSYLVGQRTREIGIRVALGADAAGVVRLVLRETLRLGVIGGAIGLTLALLVSKIFANNVEVLSTWDPLAYGGSIAVAITACLLAASVPSWRAARVDPLIALRD
jgi:ABC-type antimicrobial peptide transport system permease subunit